MKQPIELRRLRDFGETITDSFVFLKENFKPLFKALIVICGFFILVSIVSMVFTYLNTATMATNALNFGTRTYNSVSKQIFFIIAAFFGVFIVILTNAVIALVTLCYISIYLQKNNTVPLLEEVWGYFKYYFFRVLGSGILLFFVFGLGFCCCLFPGIYLSPVLSLIIPIIVIENCSFRYAWNKSFRLIKDNWWLVFGVIFIMFLIMFLAGFAANIPMNIFMQAKLFLSLKSLTLPLIIVFSVLRSVLLLAYVLPSIAISLCYFNLEEEKEGTGLLNRIENLGKNKDDRPAFPTEEY
jgi:hypothetical protein